MRKLSVVIAIIITIVSLPGCNGQRHDNSDVIGTWYNTSDDESFMVFYDDGTIKMEGYNAGVGKYSYDSREMEGWIIMPGFLIPRIHKFYCFLDDTLQINDEEYSKEKPD
ncbi:MAG: hypothetical protein ACM3S4_12180 [Burkholderiales bacterium]